MILLVDNYDSFTYNLHHYLSPFGEVIVRRNDAEDLLEIAEQAAGIVFSPGPGRPEDAGDMKDLIARYAERKPLLGICLGHQAIAQHYGGLITQAKEIRHGKVSTMICQQTDTLLKGLPQKFAIMRYHSLILHPDTLPASLMVIGVAADDQEIMALKHRDLPIYGLQFHPESIGTEYGKDLLKNFMKLIIEKEGTSDGLINEII